ncbi:universal stress protein [Frankia sp. Cppng1_Ct_nod]|uniref:universal stress protein n=1 Tax=Frankia sp. Cppng1_Ct_nod TaxID=2897162 RepID=UPI00104189DF|nr:universal stress protein [Frankia sp. Cppng1_Ct_nod]
MTDGAVPPGIVVGVDGSPGSVEALRWARHAAALHGRSVTAVLAWTADGQPGLVHRRAHAIDRDGLTAAAAEVLESVVAGVPVFHPQGEVVRRVVHGPAVLALLQESRCALMVVVGARDNAMSRRALGGVVGHAVVHHAPVPVVAVRGRGFGVAGDRRPVTVGVDGSASSVAALRWAAREAVYRDVPLRVVHALAVAATPYPDFLALVGPALVDHANDVLDDALAAGLRDAPRQLCVSSEVVVDSAARALLLESTTSQLVVVGARGHGGFAELLLGSVGDQCVRHAACPVAVVHLPG